MAEKTTIARPYAQAIFDIARDKGDLAKVSEALQILSAAVSNSSMASMIGNPEISDEKIVALLIDICGDRATTELNNFVKLLAEYDRLSVLPEISQHYDAYYAELESTVEAEVVSATDLSAAQKQSISDSLKKRLGRDVTLVCKTDASLVGGAVIRAGDLVIDGSITSQLSKLGHALSR